MTAQRFAVPIGNATALHGAFAALIVVGG